MKDKTYRRAARTHRYDLWQQVLLQEALHCNVSVAPGASEDLPKAADAYPGAQRELVSLNLPLCAALCTAQSARLPLLIP